MDIKRYQWPMIIAAGLHGALFLCSGNPVSGISRRPPVPTINRTICEFTPEDVSREADPEPDTTHSAGGPAALPILPEQPPVLRDPTEFTVPVKRDTVVIARHGLLPDSVGLPPGDGTGETGGRLSTTVDFTKLDRAPHAKVQPSPDYPARMRQEGIGGSVVVAFDVNAAGQVVRAEAVSSTQPEFVEPALRAVRHWRFEPGRRNGRVVPFRMTVPIEFGVEKN